MFIKNCKALVFSFSFQEVLAKTSYINAVKSQCAKHPEAEFIEFEPRLKYGWILLKSLFQDLSRRPIETGLWRIKDSAQIHFIRTLGAARDVLVEGCFGRGMFWSRDVLVEGCSGRGMFWSRDVLVEGTRFLISRKSSCTQFILFRDEIAQIFSRTLCRASGYFTHLLYQGMLSNNVTSSVGGIVGQ